MELFRHNKSHEIKDDVPKTKLYIFVVLQTNDLFEWQKCVFLELHGFEVYMTNQSRCGFYLFRGNDLFFIPPSFKTKSQFLGEEKKMLDVAGERI